VHIDHQLHPDSDRWAAHCRRTAEGLGVAFLSRRVHVERDSSSGPEAAARAARYGALRQIVEPGETLLTAHHADDQLETMLLAVMRGAGARGLSGMAALQPFGVGWHLRPLLSFTRSQLAEWAQTEQLAFLTDPSNADTRYDRNYLRTDILPLIERRWPSAAHSAVRSAGHLREAQEMLDAVAAEDFRTASVRTCLSLASLSTLDAMRRRNLLRYWLRQCGAPAPSTRKLAALEHDMAAAALDRMPCIEWGGFEVRRHGGLLYCHGAPPPLPQATGPIEWDGREPLTLPAGLGRLLTRSDGGGLNASALSAGMRVAFRSGRERIRPLGDPHHRKLKKLLQDSNILPWWRNRVPLIHVGGKLAAVGDLWISDEFAARAGEAGVSIIWEDRPPIEAVR
jgi:tRNA(Ile)-lysidine synthase